MNNYITLDTKKYATPANNWHCITRKPNTARFTLQGDLDVTYGPAVPVYWEGEIIGPVTARATGWGTIANLRTSLAKQESLNFTDHYGSSYTVHSIGDLQERSLSNKWDDPTNVLYISVKLVKESAT